MYYNYVTWEFKKIRGPDIVPSSSRAVIMRTPTRRTSNLQSRSSNKHLTLWTRTDHTNFQPASYQPQRNFGGTLTPFKKELYTAEPHSSCNDPFKETLSSCKKEPQFIETATHLLLKRTLYSQLNPFPRAPRA